MSLENYGILKAKPKDCKRGKGKSAHYQILVDDGKNEHRIAVNINSKVAPSELLYFADDNFSHPIIEKLDSLEMGYKNLDRSSRDLRLDYVRGGLFDTSKMVPLECDVPGPSNDLNELIQKYVEKAAAMDNGMLYAFGERWGPESFLPDSFFGFRPGSGIHDIHMNQGNSEKWQDDDAPCQDGGLLINLPEENRWVAIFLAFQSQCFNTDDTTGHCLPDVPLKVPETSSQTCEVEEPESTEAGSVLIVGALVNPEGVDSGKESVTLFNASPKTIDLAGWSLKDASGRKSNIKGKIRAGSGTRILFSGKGVILSNGGGTISLYDNQGTFMHEVKYSSREVRSGWTIVF
ncbi:MAG: hypothetical protein PWQ51_1698 [Methanolobus sp.]|jgi:uncharacterized protein YukJ|uniref:DUF2278 family protein n=1 Tax=Methanolobus sp. TaxID=1874737 RepID=UPI0024AC808A|nr:DUF2278 family protein [Methanolobus sp.]MDI3485566.1 hypothetical protein [Methanolobus sp.]MDK2830920.1 hypothetical protein [Methanolobus sp.]MDK2939533.1 hypothetical protein [Methanolobus sp.]